MTGILEKSFAYRGLPAREGRHLSDRKPGLRHETPARQNAIVPGRRVLIRNFPSCL